MEIFVDRSRAAVTLVCAMLATAALLSAQAPATPPKDPRAFSATSCVPCHNQKLKTAGLALDTVDLTKPVANAEVLEKVIGKLRAGSMPPPKMPRADAATYSLIATTLENQIDQATLAHPNPGRISAVHRLNRAEYNNAIRDQIGRAHV